MSIFPRFNVRRLAFAVLAVAATYSFGADVGWIGPDGKPVPGNSSQKSVAGFGGWLAVTPDKDWEKKWDTPAEVTPQFTTADNVRIGETLTILIFYANPRVKADGTINVRCDIQVTRPNGTTSVDVHDQACAEGPLHGSPLNLRLSDPIINYVGEPKDPLGKWIVAVTLKDVNAGVALPLRTEFTLKAARD